MLFKKFARTLALVSAVAVGLGGCGGGGDGAQVSGSSLSVAKPAADVSVAQAAPTLDPKSTELQTGVGDAPIIAADIGTASPVGGPPYILRSVTVPGMPGQIQALAKPSNVFALLPAQYKIASFADSDLQPGAEIAVRLFDPFGPYKGTVNSLPGRQMGYDAKRDRLYIAMGPQVIAVSKASIASGQTIGGSFELMYTRMGNYSQMFLDPEHDTLWLGSHIDKHSMLIKVSNVSAASGPVYTSGTKQNASSSYEYYSLSGAVYSLAIDAVRSRAYVLQGGWVDVYDLASLKPAAGRDVIGAPTNAEMNMPLRSITLVGGYLTGDISVDSGRDRLYGIDSVNQTIVAVDGASNAGFRPPFSSVGLPGVAASVSVDSANDRLYGGGSSSNAYIIDHASAIGSNAAALASSLIAVGNGAPSYNPVWAIAVPR